MPRDAVDVVTEQLSETLVKKVNVDDKEESDYGNSVGGPVAPRPYVKV